MSSSGATFVGAAARDQRKQAASANTDTRTITNQSEWRRETTSTDWILTEAPVGVQAGVLDRSVVALLGVLLVQDVDPCWTVAIGQAVVGQVDLRHKQKPNLIHKADT